MHDSLPALPELQNPARDRSTRRDAIQQTLRSRESGVGAPGVADFLAALHGAALDTRSAAPMRAQRARIAPFMIGEARQ